MATEGMGGNYWLNPTTGQSRWALANQQNMTNLTNDGWKITGNGVAKDFGTQSYLTPQAELDFANQQSKGLGDMFKSNGSWDGSKIGGVMSGVGAIGGALASYLGAQQQAKLGKRQLALQEDAYNRSKTQQTPKLCSIRTIIKYPHF